MKITLEGNEIELRWPSLAEITAARAENTRLNYLWAVTELCKRDRAWREKHNSPPGELPPNEGYAEFMDYPSIPHGEWELREKLQTYHLLLGAGVIDAVNGEPWDPEVDPARYMVEAMAIGFCIVKGDPRPLLAPDTVEESPDAAEGEDGDLDAAPASGVDDVDPQATESPQP